MQQHQLVDGTMCMSTNFQVRPKKILYTVIPIDLWLVIFFFIIIILLCMGLPSCGGVRFSHIMTALPSVLAASCVPWMNTD